jgi:hypothetical protein
MLGNQFVEEKNTGNFVIMLQTILQKIKMLGIPFQTFLLTKRKTLKISFWTNKQEKKPLETRSKPFKDKEKHMDDF